MPLDDAATWSQEKGSASDCACLVMCRAREPGAPTAGSILSLWAEGVVWPKAYLIVDYQNITAFPEQAIKGRSSKPHLLASRSAHCIICGATHVVGQQEKSMCAYFTKFRKWTLFISAAEQLHGSRLEERGKYFLLVSMLCLFEIETCVNLRAIR